MTHNTANTKTVAKAASRWSPTPDAQTNCEGRQHDAGILGVIDFRAIADEPSRSDNAEGARQARPND
jgi:hypothetical protein